MKNIRYCFQILSLEGLEILWSGSLATQRWDSRRLKKTLTHE